MVEMQLPAGLTPQLVISILVAVITVVVLAIISQSKGSSSSSSKKAALLKARKDIRELLDRENCGPIMVRLAWHDSGTYNKDHKDRPFNYSGGANGSIRFAPENEHGANAGLKKGVLLLTPIKDANPGVSWADLMQMASAEFIAMAGGPKIAMKYGRKDANGPADCAKEGYLPTANAPFPLGAKDASEHLRQIFYRMGFSDQDIVALSGAHTVGRAFKERSGTTEHGYSKSSAGATKYTCPAFAARHDGKPGIGMQGGQSWTKQWLKFDNSYFTNAASGDKELIRLETDQALEKDPAFKPHFQRYAESQEAFFKDYAAAHKKLSELGSVFDPPEGITL